MLLQCCYPLFQERLNSLGPAYCRGSTACILVFDLADLKSFEQLTKWKKHFLDHANPTDPAKFPFFIVGNKTDLTDRAVQAEAAKAWCQNNGGYSYFETCATKNEGVSAVFEKISELTSEMSNAKFQVIPLSIDAKVDALFKNMNA